MRLKILERFRGTARDSETCSDDVIRVYRRHAARALSEERWGSAEIFLDRILDVEPHNTEALLMKGYLNQHCLKNHEAALTHFRRVITLCGFDLQHPHAQQAKRSVTRIINAWV